MSEALGEMHNEEAVSVCLSVCLSVFCLLSVPPRPPARPHALYPNQLKGIKFDLGFYSKNRYEDLILYQHPANPLFEVQTKLIIFVKKNSLNQICRSH